MQDFIADKEVIDFSEHFFVHEKTPYLTVILSYRLLDHDEKRKVYRREDPRKELDDGEKQAYDALRAWRAARARQEGIPTYMIANNKQLARIIKLRASTKASLAGVSGIGEAKITRYGEEILQTIAEHLVPEKVEDLNSNEEGEQ